MNMPRSTRMVRLWFAYVMWWWQLCRFGGLRRRRVGGRRVDWLPVVCDECDWGGPLRWAVHGYEDDGSGEDVVARDECPLCGNEVYVWE